jgi:hypothetical protein
VDAFRDGLVNVNEAMRVKLLKRKTFHSLRGTMTSLLKSMGASQGVATLPLN